MLKWWHGQLTIAAKASELYSSDGKFSAFHGQAIEKQWDESNYAKDVSNNSNLDLHIVAPTSKNFIDVIEDVITLQEEPFTGTSIFMGYFVFKTEKNKLYCSFRWTGGDEFLWVMKSIFLHIFIMSYKTWSI